MLMLIRKSFIFLLVLLQFIAPLVHAHTGEKSFNLGLHIPGLESYRLDQNIPVLQNVNHGWDSEGVLVGVDAGIKSTQDFLADNTDSSFTLPPAQLSVSKLPENDCNFSPHCRSFSFKRHLSTILPRAPPAQ
jgi:hypothetical protein